MDCNSLGLSVQKDSPGKNIGVGCHSLPREICQTQELNLGLPHCRQILYHLYVYTEYIIRNARLNETQSGIKIARRNINNVRYADDTTLMSRSKEELKVMKVIKWKGWLKIQHSENLRSWHPVPSLHGKLMGEKMETVTEFIFFGYKITPTVTAVTKLKDTCSLEEKLWPT